MQDEKPDTQTRNAERPEQQEFFRVASHKRYTHPEPILDPTCVQEQMDRGDGMGVDDQKTYHHTEK